MQMTHIEPGKAHFDAISNLVASGKKTGLVRRYSEEALIEEKKRTANNGKKVASISIYSSNWNRARATAEHCLHCDWCNRLIRTRGYYDYCTHAYGTVFAHTSCKEKILDNATPSKDAYQSVEWLCVNRV